MRKYSRTDLWLEAVGNLLYVNAGKHDSERPMPGSGLPDTLSEKQKKFSGQLMRINHAGELAAQGLYYGQMVFARGEETLNQLRESAEEEKEHLAWCEQRLAELVTRPSRLSFFWHSGSLLIGMLVSFSSDRTNFGFVRETEIQVAEHLESHLGQIPRNDVVTREILRQMCDDEKKHAGMAERAGALEVPLLIRTLMKAAAKVMTVTARHV